MDAQGGIGVGIGAAFGIEDVLELDEARAGHAEAGHGRGAVSQRARRGGEAGEAGQRGVGAFAAVARAGGSRAEFGLDEVGVIQCEGIGVARRGGGVHWAGRAAAALGVGGKGGGVGTAAGQTEGGAERDGAEESVHVGWGGKFRPHHSFCASRSERHSGFRERAALGQCCGGGESPFLFTVPMLPVGWRDENRGFSAICMRKVAQNEWENPTAARRELPKNTLATPALIIGQPCQRGCLTFFPAVGKQGEAAAGAQTETQKIPKQEEGL